MTTFSLNACARVLFGPHWVPCSIHLLRNLELFLSSGHKVHFRGDLPVFLLLTPSPNRQIRQIVKLNSLSFGLLAHSIARLLVHSDGVGFTCLSLRHPKTQIHNPTTEAASHPPPLLLLPPRIISIRRASLKRPYSSTDRFRWALYWKTNLRPFHNRPPPGISWVVSKARGKIPSIVNIFSTPIRTTSGLCPS
ncbi:hypothetical protein BGX38DRAFT_557470 [Terfezia claveryi]|nr:hypothetical protein BGX38DRAFT_557470 [Terfezia claveryi]